MVDTGVTWRDKNSHDVTCGVIHVDESQDHAFVNKKKCDHDHIMNVLKWRAHDDMIYVLNIMNLMMIQLMFDYWILCIYLCVRAIVTTRNDVMIMNENDASNVANDVVNDAKTNDAQTTTNVVATSSRRNTTRALRDVKLRQNEKSKNIRDDANNEIHVVKIANNQLRIDHTLCYENNVHEKTRNDRELCRKRVANANDKKRK